MSESFRSEKQAHVEQVGAEEVVDGGLGIYVKHKFVYYGAGTEGIQVFRSAENTTVGEGLYLTSDPRDAAGYARKRGEQSGVAALYEAVIENVRLADLRNNENVRSVMEALVSKLSAELNRSDLQWFERASYIQAKNLIGQGKIHAGNLRDAVAGIGRLFTQHIQSLGYEGLVTFEGGEPPYVGDHDTYVLFDPTKAKIHLEKPVV